jgi:hypothetical protein
MSNELPQLPKPNTSFAVDDTDDEFRRIQRQVPLYTADQMREYAIACLAAAPKPAEGVDLCEVAAAIEVVRAREAIYSAAEIVENFAEPFRSGFLSACEEIACRLDLPFPPVSRVIGVDYGCPDGDCTVEGLKHPDGSVEITKVTYAPPPAAQAAGAIRDGMLPDELVPHARAWYQLCEVASHRERCVISGDLADAIIATLVRLNTAPSAEPWGWFWTHGSDHGVLTLRQDYDSHRTRWPDMQFTALYTHPAPVAAISAGWRPIAEAPMDGTRVLIADGTFVGEAHYSRNFAWVHICPRTSVFTPTHWQPLPAAPKEK